MSGLSNYAKVAMMSKQLDFTADTFKVALINGSVAEDPDFHYMSSYASAELNGSGYAGGFAGSGRQALTTPAVTRRDAENRAVFTADYVSWAAINTGTIAAAVIYKPGTSDADSLIVAFVTLPGVTPNGTPFRIDWLALPDGIFYI